MKTQYSWKQIHSNSLLEEFLRRTDPDAIVRAWEEEEESFEMARTGNGDNCYIIAIGDKVPFMGSYLTRIA